ncbi:MAG: aliphatic sulfonate ABC transporter substrate-binding protein [Clostridiaceae bacterium]
MKIRRLAALLMIPLLTAVLYTGCGANKTPSGDLPPVVNIGTQEMPNDEKIAIARKYFEEEMGVKVNIIKFEAGSIRNALISKDIDFALLGSSSATLGIASGIDVELIWVHEVLGDSEALVAKKDSGISTIQDLKGKKVATPFTTTTHYSLLKALELNGIDEKDITLLDMQMPEVYAAWQRGDIDAAYAWEPTLSKLLPEGRIILSSKNMAEKGVVTSNVELVRREFAQKHPDLVAKYIKALNKAVNLYNEDQTEAVKTLAEALNITEADALHQTKGSIWLTAEQQLSPEYFGTSSNKGALVDALKDTADFLYKQKSLKSMPDPDVFEKAVNPAYIERALNMN